MGPSFLLNTTVTMATILDLLVPLGGETREHVSYSASLPYRHHMVTAWFQPVFFIELFLLYHCGSISLFRTRYQVAMLSSAFRSAITGSNRSVSGISLVTLPISRPLDSIHLQTMLPPCIKMLL
ncbi:hypothetical protein CC78DRAFT_326029 [Lojkania enalia]|uniref:Uncharacterized protein n=1 Tax=Lojkania enalia TaxID=147567 RepID=A0A9P4N7H3_9PLEO|nr:hypothetical protein CC78DRAFT_326029 [Didymosphaeria enalia]